MYVSRNTEVRLCNNCLGRRAINTRITYSNSEFVALGIQHANCMLYTVICDLFGSTAFFHITSSVAKFKKVTENRMCVLIFYTNFV